MAQVTEQQWKQAVGELQLQLTADVFEMYIQPLRWAQGDGCVLVAPNSFVADWLNLRLGRAVEKTLFHIVGEPVAITVRVVDAVGIAQAAVTVGAVAGVTLVQAGELRDAGYVRLWHDLRCFYGPRIGLDGIGLWSELRSQVHVNGPHPLQGYAWPGLRGMAEAYGCGRATVVSALERLREAGLVEWLTGRDLMDVFERDRAAGVSDSQNAGVSARVMRRLLQNPEATRLYVVSDPLALPAFCARFGVPLALVDGVVFFVGYPGGRLTVRWREWVQNIMQARGVVRIEPEDWAAMGLLKSF